MDTASWGAHDAACVKKEVFSLSICTHEMEQHASSPVFRGHARRMLTATAWKYLSGHSNPFSTQEEK